MNTAKIEKTTQLQRALGKLAEIRADVTSGDRDMLNEKYGYSKGTISTYLNGKGYDNETATNIYVFLKARIEEREKQMA